MGLKGLLTRTVNFLGGGEEEEFETDEYGYETEADDKEVQKPSQTRNASLGATGIGRSGYVSRREEPLKMVVVEPEVFEDSKVIVDHLRARTPVIINFEATEQKIKERVNDYVSGATYAVDGRIRSVGKNILVCVPENIEIDNSKPDFKVSKLNWSAPDVQDPQ